MSEAGNQAEIEALSAQIYELTTQLHALQKAHSGNTVPNYSFQTQLGQTTLLDLFADQDTLMLIHNMGQGCRWCTVWADGFNGFLPHLESALSVVLVSKDAPDVQRRFANSRGWRFRLASHGGGDYIREQSAQAGADNMPGVVVYVRRRRDDHPQETAPCSAPAICIARSGTCWRCRAWAKAKFTPQFNYWRRPENSGRRRRERSGLTLSPSTRRHR